MNEVDLFSSSEDEHDKIMNSSLYSTGKDSFLDPKGINKLNQ
jgi:hypothetical protein